MDRDERRAMNRRQFLRRAAVTTAAGAWAVPVIHSVAATPAFASTVGTPCDHSLCVAACNAVPGCRGRGGNCQKICNKLCPRPGVVGCGGFVGSEGRPCYDASACQSGTFSSTFSSTGGCDPCP